MAIHTQRVVVPVDDGSEMSVYLARPDSQAGRAPAIIVFQEAFGVNGHIRDVAGRLARLGFVAAAPELFHRTADGFEGPYGNFDAVKPHTAALTTAGTKADVGAVYRMLGHDDTIDASRIACIGFCMGGRVSYIANATVSLRAAISMYGGGIVPDLLPLAREQQAPILMMWGGLDQHIPPADYRAIADALNEGGATQEQMVFGQAGHAFFNDERANNYNATAARQAWALAVEFLKAYGVV
jgi:carboxymethylenebutenolidase